MLNVYNFQTDDSASISLRLRNVYNTCSKMYVQDVQDNNGATGSYNVGMMLKPLTHLYTLL